MILFLVCKAKKAELWFWKIIKRNGYIVATSQNFDSRDKALSSIKLLSAAIKEDNILIRDEVKPLPKKRGRKKK